MNKEAVSADDVLTVMAARFTSGNLTPVERAHLTAIEWDSIRQHIERLQRRVDGHTETLLGIAKMNPKTEADRMRQWASDGLSGYTESTEATVKRLQDQVAESCDYLRRGAALVAMAGDQSMALSMHRNADRIQYMGEIQPQPEGAEA